MGGAEITAAVSITQGTIPSVPEQVEEYLKASGGHADPNALYILEGGGNNILITTGGSPNELGRYLEHSGAKVPFPSDNESFAVSFENALSR